MADVSSEQIELARAVGTRIQTDEQYRRQVEADPVGELRAAGLSDSTLVELQMEAVEKSDDVALQATVSCRILSCLITKCKAFSLF